MGWNTNPVCFAPPHPVRGAAEEGLLQPRSPGGTNTHTPPPPPQGGNAARPGPTCQRRLCESASPSRPGPPPPATGAAPAIGPVPPSPAAASGAHARAAASPRSGARPPTVPPACPPAPPPRAARNRRCPTTAGRGSRQGRARRRRQHPHTHTHPSPLLPRRHTRCPNSSESWQGRPAGRGGRWPRTTARPGPAAASPQPLRTLPPPYARTHTLPLAPAPPVSHSRGGARTARHQGAAGGGGARTRGSGGLAPRRGKGESLPVSPPSSGARRNLRRAGGTHRAVAAAPSPSGSPQSARLSRGRGRRSGRRAGGWGGGERGLSPPGCHRLAPLPPPRPAPSGAAGGERRGPARRGEAVLPGKRRCECPGAGRERAAPTALST